MTQNPTPDLAAVIDGTPSTERIPVNISYEIIRLFSEGLYQSPQKAIEELVSNSYDAGATRVHTLLPRAQEDGGEDADDQADAADDDGADAEENGSGPALPPLWVIDDGSGMDGAGFAQLWTVAESSKANVTGAKRPPIGQFGIGKLAAYVLAWRLTHISRVGDSIRSTNMNFRDLTTVKYQSSQPYDLGLHELTVEQAKVALADIEERDPAAWAMMFGTKASPTWTAAALSDFRQLYEKLSAGRLAWVLATGLPLHTDFKIYLDGVQLSSSKENLKKITTVQVGGDRDAVATGLGLSVAKSAVEFPGIGPVTGTAEIFERRLTEGKSDQYSRSHGFFVRVRGRIINLEDELFGLDALNHAAWSRFSMEIDADGLRNHLLSSREGVRDSDAIDALRKYMHGVFNACRRAYEEWDKKQKEGLDLDQLLRDAPSLFVTEPIVAGVASVMASGQESYYVAEPTLDDAVDQNTWLNEFADLVRDTPIARVAFEATGIHDRALQYVPDTRILVINTDHPFIEKLLSGGRDHGAATLFGTAELLLDLLLQENGFTPQRRLDVFDDRDRVLRVLAGDQPSTAAEVLRLLNVANRDDKALERAVGAAFRVLGFEYERRGGNVGGTDGILYARLGRGTDTLADYKLVYDTKQTNSPTVPADKINLGSLEDFRVTERADFGFFLAVGYDAELNLDGKLNKLVKQALSNDPPRPVTMLRIKDLRRIVELHYLYGVPLTRLRSLFVEAHTVPEVEQWIDALAGELGSLERQVPLHRLFTGIEAAKADQNARPNVNAVRAVDPKLKPFTPERLVAALSAIQTIIGKRWIEIETSGDIVLHATAEQLVAEVERQLRDLLGVNALPMLSLDDVNED